MSLAPSRWLLVLPWLVMGCHAAQPPAAPAATADEKDDGWSDGIARGTYDTCPALRASTSSRTLPARKVRRVTCGDWCNAQTVEIVGDAPSIAWGKPVLERVGLRVVGRGESPDVRIELSVTSVSHTGSGGMTCHPQLGCAGGPAPSWSTWEGGFTMLDHDGKPIARTDGDRLEPGLVRALAEHRGGRTFGLVAGSRFGPVGWQDLGPLFSAPNDWTTDPAARALLPELVDAELKSQSKDAVYLSLVDPDWGCSKEIAPRIPSLADGIRAGDLEAIRVGAYVADPRITAALVDRARAPGGLNDLLVRALRHRGGSDVDGALALAAERTARGDDSLDLGLQLWLSLRAHADEHGDPATVLGAVHFFGTQRQIARALDALDGSNDPRSTYLIDLPLMVGNTSAEVEAKAVAMLARRGALGTMLLAKWLSFHEVEQATHAPWDPAAPSRPLESERALVDAAIERTRRERVPDLDAAIALLERFHQRAWTTVTTLERLLARSQDPAVDVALEKTYASDQDPELSWALCLGVRRGAASARARAAGTDVLRRCAS